MTDDQPSGEFELVTVAELVEQNRVLKERLEAMGGTIAEPSDGFENKERPLAPGDAPLVAMQDPAPAPGDDQNMPLVGVQAPPAVDDNAALAQAVQMLAAQNQQLMDNMQQQQQEMRRMIEQGQGQRSGMISGGFMYPDGQIHVNETNLSEERQWDAMESEGGLLG